MCELPPHEAAADAAQSSAAATAPALVPPKFYFTPEADVVVLHEALALEVFTAPRGQKLKRIDAFGERMRAALHVCTFEKNGKVHKKSSGTYSQYVETQRLLNEVCARIEACEAQHAKKAAKPRRIETQADTSGARREAAARWKRRKVDASDAASRVLSMEAQLYEDLDTRKSHWEAELALRKQENEIRRREIQRQREEVRSTLAHAELERNQLDRAQAWESEVAHRRDDNQSHREKLQRRREEISRERMQTEKEMQQRQDSDILQDAS